MNIHQVAAQFYTLRDFCKTAGEFAESCAKVRAIGYEAIQISGVGPIPESEVVAICKGEGLVICATHEDGKTILNSPEKVVDRLAKLGCKYTAYPYPGGVDFTSAADVDRLIAGLDAAGQVLRDAGQVLTYHNHACEFLKLDGEVVLDRIYSRTNPANLQGEIDTYWVQVGGADPVAWCRKLSARLPLLHLKDCVATAANGSAFCEIGNGNLNFPGIIAAAGESGCEWFIVEQDTCPGDPFDSLRISFDYIKANLVG